MKNNIQVGDVVRLKSGSPAMTVSQVHENGSVQTVFMSAHGEVKNAFLPIAAIKKAE